MKRNVIIVLSAIFILGLFLRFYQLGSVPFGFHRDEASLGYEAFSILKTGRDMTGHFLPLNIQSYLYSPAGYIYFTIPFIWLFGLNEFAVRFASAFFGSITIIASYFLVVTLFWQHKSKAFLGLTTALLIAISPWNINLARTATENVVVVFFITIGLLLYLFWIKKQQWYFFVGSFAALLIAIATYQAPRAFLPLFLPIVILAFAKTQRQKLISFGAYGIFIVVPLIVVLLSPQLSQRIRMLSVFQNPATQLILNEQLREDGIQGINSHEARIFNNKLVDYSQTFLQNYFNHFSYNFLFTDAGLPIRYKVDGMGLFYIAELPLLLLGLWSVLKGDRRIAVLVLWWIIVAPVGSALTFDDVPNLQRTLLMFPAISIVSALGLLSIKDFITKTTKNHIVKFGLWGVVICIGIFNVAYYLHMYYVNNPVHMPWFRQEGYKALVQEVDKLSPEYKQVVVTEADSAPGIFFLFYNAYDPVKIQKTLGQSDRHDFTIVPFDKYTFSIEDCPLQEGPSKNGYVTTGKPGVLYINDGISGECNLSGQLTKVVDKIYRPDNTVAFTLATVK